MLTREMTRKEFVSYLGVALGVLVLNRFSLGSFAKPVETRGLISYGNGAYGGKTKG